MVTSYYTTFTDKKSCRVGVDIPVRCMNSAFRA